MAVTDAAATAPAPAEATPVAAGKAAGTPAEVTATAAVAVAVAEQATEPVQASLQLEEMRALLDLAETAAAERKAARELVGKAIARLAQNRGETWIQKARLRPFIQRIDSTFHESNYGFSTFNEMLESMSDLVEVRRGDSDHELRLRPVVSVSGS